MDKLVPLFYLLLMFIKIQKAVVCQQNFESSITTQKMFFTVSNETVTVQSNNTQEVHSRSLDELSKNPESKQNPNKLETQRKVRNLNRKDGTKKILAKKRTEMLQQGKPCLHWIPTLNITAVPAVKNLIMDYCASESAIIPNTKACFISDYSTYCVVIEGPACSYTFENVSTGNITIWIKARCDVCFESMFYNTECPTPIFEQEHFIFIESPRLNESEKSGIYQRRSHARVDIIAGCTAAGFGCIVLTMLGLARIMKKCNPALHRSDPPVSLEMTAMLPRPTSDPSTIRDINFMLPLPTSDPPTSPDINCISTSNKSTFSGVNVIPSLPTPNTLNSPGLSFIGHLPTSNPSISELNIVSPPPTHPSTSSEMNIASFPPMLNPSISSYMNIVPPLPTSNPSTSSNLNIVPPLPTSNPSLFTEKNVVPLPSTLLLSASPYMKTAPLTPSTSLPNPTERQALPTSQLPVWPAHDSVDKRHQQETNNCTLDFYFCVFDKEFESPPGSEITLNFDIPYTLIRRGCRVEGNG